MKVSGQDGTYLQYYKFSGRRDDAGDKRGYIKAIIDSALEREDLKGVIEKYLREIWKRGKEGIT
ncbi:MAG: hypothetical protein ISS94_02905 [Candidatus Syntrophoarchaeum sp.]|nr:hypothetical protein [Candidatus Syntrophoarchaeum sp.]